MFLIQKKWMEFRYVLNVFALVCTLIFGNISAIAIYDIIKNKTVFMTSIHAIFLNPFFLITGAYLGMYVLYLVLLFTLNNRFYNAE